MAMTVTIPPLDRTSSSFKTDLDTLFMTTLPAWSAEANALQADVSAKQATASNAATTATTQAGLATTQAQLATTNGQAQVALATTQAALSAASAASAINAPGTSAASASSDTIALGATTITITADKAFSVGQFVVIASTASPANYMVGQITAFTSATGSMTVNVTSIGGSGTFTAWTIALSGRDLSVEPVIPQGTTGQYWRGDKTWQSLPSGSSLVRSPRTSNAIIGAGDKSSFIDITSGTFTQTFAAAETLGNGWFCYLQNSGTGDITLDPNASETIDGLTSYIMYPGEVRLIQCDGSALRTVVLKCFYRVFTASGTFVKPPGYALFESEMWGGGASGGKHGSAHAYGGSGGGYSHGAFMANAVPSTSNVIVGAGGAPVPAATVNQQYGNSGGESSFGSLLSANGASGPSGGYGQGLTQFAEGSGIAPLCSQGFSGANYSTITYAVYGGVSSGSALYAGKSLFGAACGGSFNSASMSLVAPGYSKFGGAGGGAANAYYAGDGQSPGGGGGAIFGDYSGLYPSGAGARGEIRILGVI